MPKRQDISSIMIIGAGPIVIGQACEFDYSGTQACRALKDEGYRIILVNSNPATIMTDPQVADATYIEPITPEFVEKIIEKEKPDAILPTMGGQTALNTVLTLKRLGVLEKHGIELIGANAASIDKAEDREKFRDAMDKIGLETPSSRLVHNMTDAMVALEDIGLPAIIRPSFTLGGTGGGIAYNKEEYLSIIENGLDASPTNEVLVEESVLGWKEFEMEVVRDRNDNCIIVCSIENIDPMGVHTGDSITVAPALTLTDREYQNMRNASIAVLREIGVETGGSNVQFAINPENGRMVVIEMNPRVSRSSALASKATGFPIAKVAAKLAVGYTLNEISNEITGGAIPASFEPTIDYVVTKVPRFAFEKFPGAEPVLTTSMKSVGEAMAVGRCFQESLQKALRSLETGLTGLNEVDVPGLGLGDDTGALRAALGRPTPDRLLVTAEAFRRGMSIEDVHEICRYDPWFLRQIEELVREEKAIQEHGLPDSAEELRRLKGMGFSDGRLAALTGLDEARVREHRLSLNVLPVFKRIDTCSSEFEAPTAYMYSTYEPPFLGDYGDECQPTENRKIVILGGGPNRIGQGIEFDYCCCHACFALSESGYETIMINCNPETVSTDYDTSDRLYFEPLTEEDVLAILRAEQKNGTLLGVIVQFGGQSPLKLSAFLKEQNINILGTTPEAIDFAEDRDQFKKVLEKLGLRQPSNGIARTGAEAEEIANSIGYPVVIRPSYVLGGRAMEIVHDVEQLRRYIVTAVKVSGKNPVLIDQYLQNAIEVDVDCLADGENARVVGVMEHIEEAGIHSGDSACVLPPHSLSHDSIEEIERQTLVMAKALSVVGLMNVQFAVCNGEIFVLEVNPRASRTVPFVAKVTGNSVARIGALIMAGQKLSEFSFKTHRPDYVGLKEAVFPFSRFPGVDTILGPEMRSTGEVMGIGPNFAHAFAKAQLGASNKLPLTGTAFLSVKNSDKNDDALFKAARRLVKLGFKLVATRGTCKSLNEQGIPCRLILKVMEGQPHIVDAIKNGEIHLVFNTVEGHQSILDSRSLRRSSLVYKVPYFTTVAGMLAATEAISELSSKSLEVLSIQDYFGGERG